MNKDILICGVGGQGTVLASKITAAAAMKEGETVHSAETIGMAQRGGPVTSHVRIGDHAFSPLIPQGKADIILAFEPAEAVRNLGYIRPGGLVISSTVPVKPAAEALKPSGYDPRIFLDYLDSKCECIFIDSNKMCEPFGSSKFFNIIILGVAAGSGKLEISSDTIISEIEKRVPARFVEANKQAFANGYAKGREAGRNLNRS